MDKEQAIESGRKAVHQADQYLHENPFPTVLGALAIGFLIGILVRPAESKPASKLDDLRERLEESESDLRSLLTQLSKTAKKKYKKGSGVVRDTIHDAVDAASHVDVDDYVDPAAKWFRKLWGKYVS